MFVLFSKYKAQLFGLALLMACLSIKNANAQSIVENESLGFGTIVADPAGDVVRVHHNTGALSSNGSSILVGPAYRGNFTVTGTPNSLIGISFDQFVFLNGPGKKMRLRNFRHDAGNSPTLNGAGTLTFNVGAKLKIKPAQDSGIYTGTYTVIVDYQ